VAELRKAGAVGHYSGDAFVNSLVHRPERIALSRTQDDMAAATPAAQRVCVTCGTPLQGEYCHVCGERTLAADDKRLISFLKDALNGAFDTDARLWRSLRVVVTKPGELTAEHLRGRRRIYLSPLQLFLLANLLFFTMIGTIGGFDTFTTRLRHHVEMGGYGAAASELVARRARAGTTERIAYEQRFDEATPRYANSLVIVMVPLLAVALYGLYGGHRYFVHHLVFALHFFAWLLLLQVVLSLILRLLSHAVLALIDADTANAMLLRLNSELFVGLPLTLLVVWYLVAALRRSYGDSLPVALARALGVLAGLAVALTLYRMFLFYVVYYRIG
jgi:hypothetical protein